MLAQAIEDAAVAPDHVVGREERVVYDVQIVDARDYRAVCRTCGWAGQWRSLSEQRALSGGLLHVVNWDAVVSAHKWGTTGSVVKQDLVAT